MKDIIFLVAVLGILFIVITLIITKIARDSDVDPQWYASGALIEEWLLLIFIKFLIIFKWFIYDKEEFLDFKRQLDKDLFEKDEN